MGIRDRIIKALTLPPGATARTEQQILALDPTQSPQMATQFVPLQRDPALAAVPFSPGIPLVPALINQPRADGRAEPRRWEVPVAWNLQLGSGRAVEFNVLREIADQNDLVRKCIEFVKSTISGLEWDIVLSPEATERIIAEGGQFASAARQARVQLLPEIARARDFWVQPDRINGIDFPEWVAMAIEEMLVIDALTIYPNHTADRTALHSLEILDGATIKPLLDDRGARPQPPQPAYQQILWGFPRGEFTASADSDGEFSADDLIYAPRTRRSFTPYGFSAVERSIPPALLYMVRMQWLNSEFDDSTLPQSFMQSGASFGGNPDVLRAYEAVLNDELAGNFRARHRIKLLPDGMIPQFPPPADERFKADLDELIVKLTCLHFGVLPTQLGFAPKGGLGGAGVEKGEGVAADVTGLKPMMQWVTGLCNQMSYRFLNMPKDLAFVFRSAEAEDANKVTQRRDTEIRGGQRTLNEARSELGLPQYTFPEADMPLVSSGLKTLQASNAEGAAAPAPASAPDAAGPAGGGGGALTAAMFPDGGSSPTEHMFDQGAQPAQQHMFEAGAPSLRQHMFGELSQFAKWARPGRTRPFRFEHVDVDTADMLNKMAAVDPDGARDLAGTLRADLEKGGSLPKESAPASWPGATRDEALALIYAGRIRDSAGSVDPLLIATRWLAEGGDPESWLIVSGWQLVGERVAKDLDDLWAEACCLAHLTFGMLAVGHDKAAGIVPRDALGRFTSWQGWTPGDPDAARAVLIADGAEGCYQRILGRSAITIGGMNATAIRRLARILADALHDNWTVEDTAQRIHDSFGRSFEWAEMVARTELRRVVTEQTLDDLVRARVPYSRWLTSHMPGVCGDCGDNEAQGPIPVGEVFLSGHRGPPEHPQCMCVLVPVWADQSKALWPDLVKYSPDQPRVEGGPHGGEFTFSTSYQGTLYGGDDPTSDRAPTRNDYEGVHDAPGYDEEGGNTLADTSMMFPEDLYGPNGVRFYGSGGTSAMEARADRESWQAFKDFRGKPDAIVRIYRAVPKSLHGVKINPGDWVTTSKTYAKIHGEGPLNGDYQILEADVRAGDLFTDANSISEFGWSPK